MLLRRTSGMSGAMALALTGLLGWGSASVAQQPPAAAVPPTPAAQLSVGATVGDSTGLITLPIRAAADASGKGTLCGKLTVANTGAANKNVYLVEGGKVVAAAKTNADGEFEVTSARAGEFTLMAGPFDANGVVRKMVRVDAAEGATQAVVLQQKGAAPGALAAGAPPVGESVLHAIGNKASGNADVSFVNGRFVVNGQPVSAGNEFANLENGSFRGIVTSLDDAGVRTPLPGANVYLIRRGQVVARTVSGVNGAFHVSGLVAGGYTVLATVGGYGATEVSLNGVPGVEQELVRPFVAATAQAVVPPVVAPVPSPYFAGTTAGVPGAVAVRFPFSAIAVQRVALRDAVGPAGVSTIDGEFRMEGADDVIVKVAFCQPAGLNVVPVINLTPAPWEDLRLFIGSAQFDNAPVGLVPTPAAEFGGGGFGAGGGGGGGGFGGAGLAGLAALAALAAAGGGGGNGNNPPPFSSPFRP